MKSEFLLDPEIAYLNHGSFGACPRPVFQAYQGYQRELEREPVDFLQRTFPARMRSARESLAGFLGSPPEQVAFVRNATYGMNLVARSLQLQRGDTVLISNQEYGAIERMWEIICSESGAQLVHAPIPIPTPSTECILDAFAACLDSSVRVLSFSHITSETAQRFPITELLDLARERGATSVIDGAHAPGQLPLDLTALGADFYVGNCHKWMLSPKGAAFVHAASRWTDQIRPPVISWGNISQDHSALLLENEWQGTIDISAILAVTDAISFFAQHRWLEEVAPRCSRLLQEELPRLLSVTGQTSLYHCNELLPPQLATLDLPPGDHASLHSNLFHQHKVEIPVFASPRGFSIRVSLQAYNDENDLRRLADALKAIL